MDKAPDAFRTISEVATDLELPQHVLRFWETRFPQIKPMKRSGGRRYYRPDDVELLRGIRQLLYGEGYTIRGVQRILREQGVKTVQNVVQGGALPPTEAFDREDEDPVPSTAEAGASAEFPQAGEDDEEEAIAPPRAPPTAPPVSAVKVMTGAPPPGTVSSPPSPASRLTRDDVRKLEATLHELVECRRLLDAGFKGA